MTANFAAIALDVPAEWERARIKAFARERNEYSQDGEEELLSVSEYYGVAPRASKIADDELLSRADSLEGYRVVRPKDVAINYMLAWKGALGVSNYEGIVSPAYSVLELDEARIVPRFLHYLFRTPLYRAYFRSESTGIIDSRLRLYPDRLRAMTIGLPAKQLQADIAAYLDRETARIDALVERKQRLVELLKEKRQAVITQAVTRGLDPTVPMKDSGVEWLGEVPAHWWVTRLKFAAPEITVGIVVTPSKYYVDIGVPCLRSLNVSTGQVTPDNLVFISEASNALLSKSQLRTGDIVVVRTGQTGTAAIVPEEFDGANCVDLLVIRRSKNVSTSFLHALLSSDCTLRQIEAHSVGAIQAHYNTATLSNLWIALPPRDEQEANYLALEQQLARLDAIMSLTSRSIDLLQEHRSALITAAVTGQIDVRDAA